MLANNRNSEMGAPKFEQISFVNAKQNPDEECKKLLTAMENLGFLLITEIPGTAQQTCEKTKTWETIIFYSNSVHIFFCKKDDLFSTSVGFLFTKWTYTFNKIIYYVTASCCWSLNTLTEGEEPEEMG